MSKTYSVYIVASRSRALYVGVTGDLLRRVYEHRSHAVPGHTSRYRITRLVHFEQTTDVHAALTREKEIKGWRRSKKVALIEAGNPTWEYFGRRMVRRRTLTRSQDRHHPMRHVIPSAARDLLH